MITIIAEKPSVAQSIARVVGATSRRDGYLSGNGYYVTWAFGHMVEIYAEGGDDWGSELPLLPDHFSLRIGRAKSGRADAGYAKQLGVIRSLVHQSESIINAGDAGREGELIQRYIYKYIGVKVPVSRLWISSLTDSAIREGMRSLRPSEEYDALYEAGKARSEADWLVGINATRALTKVAGGEQVLSLGRVQTPTLALICRRFLENRDFVESPFWTLDVEARLGKTLFKARSVHYDDYSEVCRDLDSVRAEGFLRVSSVEKATRAVLPPLLHDLTSLQKECNKRYSMTADATLSAAQNLYEKKLITYPRTGSRYITEDVFKTIPAIMKAACGETLPHYNRRSVSDVKVTDHHAILPTGETPGELSVNENRVYSEVILRLREAFLPLCEVLETKLSFESAGVQFTAQSSEVLTKGWKAVRGEQERPKDQDGNDLVELLPAFKEGDACPIESLQSREGKTRPKPLLTDATLLEAMEHAGREVEDESLKEALKDCGLGTPATRAGEIETLLRRGYIERQSKNLTPTPLGLSVYELVRSKAISDVALTAAWEKALAEIAEGGGDVCAFNKGIRELAATMVDELLAESSSASSLLKDEIVSGASCPLCGKVVLMTTKIVRCSDSDCGWKIWRTYFGKTLSQREVLMLLGRGETSELKGLVSKSGKPFSGILAIDSGGQVALRFVDHSKDADGNDLTCPQCGKPVKVFPNSVICSDEKCGWKMWRMIAGKTISDKMIPVLLSGGTTSVIKGFLSKTGKRFDAALKLNTSGALEFVFQKKQILKKSKSW